MSDLVERLRNEHATMLKVIFGTDNPSARTYSDNGNPSRLIGEVSSPMSKAADRIEALEADKNAMQFQISHAFAAHDAAEARIEALEAAIIAALLARDEDRGDILRKALHGGGE